MNDSGFADRMTFSVDADNLYISMREGIDIFSYQPTEHRTIVIVIPKASLITGTPATPFFSERLNTHALDETALHMAVDMKSAAADPDVKQYLIATKHHPFSGLETFETNFILAAIADDGMGSWTIERFELDITSTPAGDASFYFTDGHITTPDNGD